MKGLEKNDSDLIAFVNACLFFQAIDKKEINDWATHIVATEKDYPMYIVDLMAFNEAIFKVTNVIGFAPHWERTEDEEKALYGISYKRGINVYDSSVSKQQALDKLDENPLIEKKFRKVFPFINIEG